MQWGGAASARDAREARRRTPVGGRDRGRRWVAPRHGVNLGEHPAGLALLVVDELRSDPLVEELPLDIAVHRCGKPVERVQQRSRELHFGGEAAVAAPMELREREGLADLAVAGEEVGVPYDESGPVAVLAPIEPDEDVASHVLLVHPA